MTANNPPALAFNSGLAYMIDADTNPTPTNIKILQSASLDLKASTKELFGQNIFPVAVGRSQIKVSGKLKFADYQPRQIRDFIGGANNSLMTAGQTLLNPNEAHSIPTTPYQVTVTNSATFVLDLGVYYTTTGISLTNVASAPTTGQYSYSSGVYTFAAADTGLGVNISYTSTLAAIGATIAMSNTSAGSAFTFKTVMGSTYNGIQTNFILNACIPQSLKLYDSKIGDFAMPELDFQAVVDASGNLGIVSIPVTS